MNNSPLESLINVFAFMCEPEIEEMGNEQAGIKLLELLEVDPLTIFTTRHAPVFVALMRHFNLHDPDQSKGLNEIDPEVAIKILVGFHKFKTKVMRLENSKQLMINRRSEHGYYQ